MLLLAIAIGAAAPAATTQPEVPGKATRCMRNNPYVAGAEGRYDGKPLAPQKLTELPPANMYIAVDRFDENGCLAPIIVKYSVGR